MSANPRRGEFLYFECLSLSLIFQKKNLFLCCLNTTQALELTLVEFVKTGKRETSV